MNKKIKELIRENRASQKKILQIAQELEWAHVYHDSIRGKTYLEKLPLNIGRWAGNYAFFYVLNRILTDYKPNKILELGLGESSKFISTVLDNYLLDSSHLVVEQDEKWNRTFQERFKLSSRSKVVVCPMEKKEIKGFMVNSYADFDKVTNDKFDLYLIDGPFGSESFSRYDIINLVHHFELNDEFVMVFDDYQRTGEQETINDLLEILKYKKMGLPQIEWVV